MGDGYFLLTNLLSEDEKRVITSITAHIERGEKRVGIQQIANENFLSTTTIVKMCKRLGFDGYSELYYYLSRQFNSHGQDRSAENIKSLIDNYSDELLDRFCGLLDQSRRAKLFTTGEAFPTLWVPISPSGCLSAALWCSTTSISMTICCSATRTTCPTRRRPRR